jgi:hypothetical protein
MSAFLLIVPEGWTEIENVQQVLGDQSGYSGMIDTQDWQQFTQRLYDFQAISETLKVVDARYFSDPEVGVQRLWVVVEPV